MRLIKEVRHPRLGALLASTIIVSGSLPATVQAQQGASAVEGEGAGVAQDNSRSRDAIVVTAQKREQRIQDVPTAVSVVDTISLASSNQTRLRDFFDTIPGLQVSPSPGGGGQQTVAIRGITAGIYANPTIGTIIDDVPFGAATYDFSPEIDPSDLARIEVLRGPQGTLYGASSMGGLIKYVTKDPSTSEFSGRAEAGLHRIAHGDNLGYSVRGGVNIPLSEVLAVRASGFTTKDPGYIDNPFIGRTDVNDSISSGARVSALWDNGGAVTVKLNALYQHTVADGNSEETDAPGVGDYEQNYIPGVGHSDATLQAYSAVINAEIGAVDVTSVTGYNRFEKINNQDYSPIPPWGPSATSLFGVDGAPTYFSAEVKRLTQEVRATFQTGEKLEWLVGAFFSDEDTPIFQSINAADTVTGEVVGTVIDFDIPFAYKEFALFADPTLHLTDRFSIQLGARYSWTKAVFDEVIETGELLGGATIILPAIEKKDEVFTYLVAPQFEINDDLMVYGRVATGYRPGRSNSFNPDPAVPGSADPDTTINYELGMKGDLADGLISFDASLYYIDWKDIQITLISDTNNLAYTANAARATSKGGELSATLHLSDGLTIGGWASYNDAKITEGVVNAATFAPEGSVLPFTAKFAANLSVDKRFWISKDVAGYVGATLVHSGKRYGTILSNPNRSIYPAYQKVDLRAGLEYGDWDFNLYARNVGDKRGLLGGGPGNFPPSAFVFIQPRSYGFTISKTF